MTTGYTRILLEEPETTFEAFALRCARAFGVLIDMREEPLDAPLPEAFAVDPCYLKSLREAEKAVRALEKTTLEEASREAKREYKNLVRQWARGRKEVDERNAIFAAMIAKVEAWTPPTSEHEGMKAFMLDQLKDSMSSGTYYATEPVERTPEAWLADERRCAADRAARCRETYDAAVRTAKTRTEWMRDLRNSLRGELQ